MPWIKFTADYNWWTKMSTKPFHVGDVVFATRDLAELALGAGVAEKTIKPEGATDDDEQQPQT